VRRDRVDGHDEDERPGPSRFDAGRAGDRSGDAPTKLYTEVAGHEGPLFVAGLLFMLSSILLVPAAIGIVHLLRDRGVVPARRCLFLKPTTRGSLATDRRLHDSAPDLDAVVPEQSLLGESARMRACPPSR
jgi:hypothetical protein